MADAYTGGRFVGTPNGWRWVPQNTAAQRLAAIEAARARGENPAITNLRNPLPVPLVTPGIDAATNVFGSVAAGATNALPGLTRMLFGGDINPTQRQAAAAPAANTPAPQLRAPVGAAPAARPAAAPSDPVAKNLALQSQVRSVFGNAVFSGGAGQVRTPADYDRLVREGYNPVRGSRHETGDATDFNIPGMGAKDLPAVRANLRAAGVNFEDVIYHDNHFHLELPRSGTTQRAGGTAGPQLQSADPNNLMSFIPTPHAVPHISLPDAPQREMPADRPTLKLADKEALLTPLREAMAIDPREKTQDAWDRIQGMLQGMAGAAGQFSGDFAVGQLLAAAGGAGLAGFREVRDEQRQLDREETEAERQVRIALAQEGYKIDLGNLDTENQNQTIQWQSGEDKKATTFANADSMFQTRLREILANADIDAGNIGAVNQANLARGQVGINATQNLYDTANQSTVLGWQADQQGVQLEREIARRQALAGPAAPLLAQFGIPAERTTGETPQITNAREAANRIAAQGGTAGTSYLANEMLISGTWDNGKFFSEDLRKQIQSAIQQEKPEAARLLILQQLQGNPAAVATLAQELAASGSLVAQMMVQ